MTIKEDNEINSTAIISSSKQYSITYQGIWNIVTSFFSTQGSLSRSVDSSGVSDIFSGVCEFFLKISHLGGFHIYNILWKIKTSLFCFIWITDLWTSKYQVIICGRNVQSFSESINLSRSLVLIQKWQQLLHICYGNSNSKELLNSSTSYKSNTSL